MQATDRNHMMNVFKMNSKIPEGEARETELLVKRVQFEEHSLLNKKIKAKHKQ